MKRIKYKAAQGASFADPRGKNATYVKWGRT